MPIGRAYRTAIAVLLAAGALAMPAAGQEPSLTASLQPAEQQDPRAYPYRLAELTIRNGTAQVVRSVALRWRQGGPELVYPLALAPAADQTLRVALPAASPEQTYRAIFSARESQPPLAELDLSITWPVAMTTGPALVDPDTCRPWREARAAWPAALRRGVFVTAVLFSVALAAALFLRRPGVRLLAAGVVLVVAGAGMSAAMARQGLVVRRVETIKAPSHGGTPQGAVFYILTARRTVEWRHHGADLAPMYDSRQQMAGDTTTFRPGGLVSVRMTPDTVRLFRLCQP